MEFVQAFNINGVCVKQTPCIELKGKPNAATEGRVGLFAIDVTSPLREVYKCVAVNGSIYTWELLTGGNVNILEHNADELAHKEIIQKAIDDVKAAGLQQIPLFANSIDELNESGDKSKLYVLPDGNIYAYMYSEIAKYPVNLAEPLPNNTTDTTKWVNGYRLSSTAITTSSGSGKTICNPIPVVTGDVIRIKGVSFVADVDRAGVFFANGTSFAGVEYVSALPNSDMSYALINGVHTFTILSKNSNLGTFRCAFTTPTNASSIVITKNEPIEATIIPANNWADTGHAFVPANYEPEINALQKDVQAIGKIAVTNKDDIAKLNEQIADLETGKSASVPTHWVEAIATAKAKIANKQALGGVNCASFVWTSDIHASAGIDEKGIRLGLVAKAIMDEADIPLFVSTGDLMSQSSHPTTDGVYTELALAKKWFSPIPYYQQALIMGNHDGAWGDTTSGYYYKQLPLDVVYNLIYRKQAMDLRRVSGDNGTYYYIDNVSQKMRYIMLNTNNTPKYEENADGTAKFDRFHSSCLGQTQLDWLTNIALNMPDGYTACIFGHEPYVGDYSQLVGIVDAYNNKGAFKDSFTDSANTWRNSTINVNFASAKGEIAGVFAGHTHIDLIRHTGNNPMYSTCPLIITPNSLGGEVRDGTTRTDGTNTEFAMDIVTVDTKHRKIYMTRLGAGIDREVSY